MAHCAAAEHSPVGLQSSLDLSERSMAGRWGSLELQLRAVGMQLSRMGLLEPVSLLEARGLLEGARAAERHCSHLM